MILGLTGGIGTGKSTVAEIFREKGVPIVCADEIAKKIIDSEKIQNQIFEIFGKNVFSEDRLDRKKLREIVFRDAESVEKLNNITHPAIIEEIKFQISKKKRNQLLIVDIPLLFEGNYGFLVEKVLLISAEKSIQIERTSKRDSVSEENVLNIINNQMNLEDKKKRSDYIIENNGTIEELRIKIDKLIKEELS